MSEIIEEIEDLSFNTQARRWCFTINNPFGTIYEDIDISQSTLPIKENYYNSSIMQDLENSKCFIFKYIKIKQKVDDYKFEELIIKRPFFKDWESVEKYFDNIEHRRYVVFQLEVGEDGTEHLQGGIFFTICKRFKTVKDLLPFAHLEKAKGSNSQVRDYCMKSETQVKEPVEIGTFAEERERTDIKDFVQLVQAGFSKLELSKLYPSLYLKERNKLDMVSADMYEEYSYKCRDVDVTYIYGNAGVGKSTWIRRNVGLKNSFWVTLYDNSMFTNYNYQDNLILDEFRGNITIQTLNMMLDHNPFQLRGLGCLKFATYHHVYIVSNYKLTDLYKNVQTENLAVFQGLNRRIHKIIRIDPSGKAVIERDTEWEDCTDELDLKDGITKKIKRTYEINSYGQQRDIYNKDSR